MASTVISVVIPIYNAEKYIKRCLDSILEQGIEQLEIICVDDGSTDDSYKILKEYEHQENVHILQQKNSYAGIARNLGASVAKGKYIHFMDIDDYVMPGSYQKIIDVINEYEPDFIKARALAKDFHSGEIYRDWPYSMKHIEKSLFGKNLSFTENPTSLIEVVPVPWNGVVNKKYFMEQRLAFNNLKCVNDRSFFVDAISHAKKIFLLDEYIVMHHVNNLSSLAGGRRTKDNFYCYIESSKLILDIIKDLPYELQCIIKGKELLEFAKDFLSLKPDVQDVYKAEVKEVVFDSYLNDVSETILENKAVKECYWLVGGGKELITERITDLIQLNIFCDDVDEIIIYGAGRVSYALLQYLAKQNNILDKIFCIMVSDKKWNPDNILGIPVCTKKEVGIRKNATVLVATFEHVQEEIYRDLCTHKFKQVKAMSNIVYAHLRKDNQDLSADIVQNTQLILDNVGRVRTEMWRAKNELLQEFEKMNSRIGRLETCVQNGVKYTDEVLPSNQYKDALEKWYHACTGKELNLDMPQTYNEKIQWIKLYGITPLMTKLTDKYEVREWVRSKIGEEYLVPLIGVWERFEDIEIDKLPKKFVLKCNHGCAWNEIVLDKDIWNVRLAQKKFARWMDTNFAFRGGLQLQYRDITPKILAEEYLENGNGDLYDYKFWCFDGKVEFIMFLSERASSLRMNNYDRDWKLLPFTYDHPNCEKEILRPDNLDEMIRIAEELAQGFSHVRVDLYRLNDGTIKFGEMTFTSCNGVCGWSDESVNNRLGELIKL